jgi:zinc/manganese transport system permease protein
MSDSIAHYLSYDFVRNALVAGSLAAILGAVVGYFVVIRNVSFAAHGRGPVRHESADGNVIHFRAGGRDDGCIRKPFAAQ